MVRLPLQCVLWGSFLISVHPEPPTACRENQYLLNNQCCNLCPPGEKLVTDCTEFTDTHCLPCNKDEFSNSWNREQRCHQHRYCDPNLGLQVEREGSSETDTTCSCGQGQHCTSQACERCVPHSSCAPGFGVTQTGTGTSDTICEPCPHGFFSNVSSAIEKCRPWTSCKTRDLVELQAGTQMTDAVCGFQHRRRVLLVIPVVGAILLAVSLAAVFIRKVVKKPKQKVVLPVLEQKDPEETDTEDFLCNPAKPVQETLHGCQLVTQENGKESRIPVQERQCGCAHQALPETQ